MFNVSVQHTAVDGTVTQQSITKTQRRILLNLFDYASQHEGYQKEARDSKLNLKDGESLSWDTESWCRRRIDRYTAINRNGVFHVTRTKVRDL